MKFEMIRDAFDRDQFALQRATGVIHLLQAALDREGLVNDIGTAGKRHIAAEIGQYRRWTGEGSLGIDNPLIAGPTVFICDECVALCMDIIREPSASDAG